MNCHARTRGAIQRQFQLSPLNSAAYQPPPWNERPAVPPAAPHPRHPRNHTNPISNNRPRIQHLRPTYPRACIPRPDYATLFLKEMRSAAQPGRLFRSRLLRLSAQAVAPVIIIAITIGVAVPDPA